MSDYEIWTDPEGRALDLVPVAQDFDDGWYPESPGQRPPQTYHMRDGFGITHAEHTVLPLAPWSAYDAIHDRLQREGWTRDTSNDEPYESCEHGLSASLCSGPNHY